MATIYVTVTSDEGFDEYWLDSSEFDALTDILLEKMVGER